MKRRAFITGCFLLVPATAGAQVKFLSPSGGNTILLEADGTPILLESDSTNLLEENFTPGH